MIQVIIFLYLFSSGAYAWTPFGPNNYDDCVLVNIKDAQNPQAVFAVKAACRSKFPLSDAEAVCEEFNNISNSGLSFSQIRGIKGYEEASDEEIISHAKSIGVNVNKLILEKRCNDSRKIKK